MRTIKVSEDVWNEIAERGKFGETEDAVLRRVFGIEPINSNAEARHQGRGSVRFATKKMSTRVEGGKLVVEFEDEPRKEWPLPDRDDKSAIRNILGAALAFAKDNDATEPGQTNAVRKALTDAGYHLTK